MLVEQSVAFEKSKSKIILLDVFLIAAIYAIPYFTHLLSLPLYVIEPMRLAVFATILFSNKTNSLIIAVTLPVFSVLTSGHPLFVKALIMSFELVVNVLIFYQLNRKFDNLFLSAGISILLSKIVYYAVKYAAISAGLLSIGLISTSLALQFVVLIVTSGLVFFAARLNSSK